MRRSFLLFVLLGLFAFPAVGNAAPHSQRQLLTARLTHAQRTVWQARHAIVFMQRHHFLYGGPMARRRVAWGVVRRARARIDRALDTQRVVQARLLEATYPEHHALWECIHEGEGSWSDPNSGGNGHYGGLQMTPGWEGEFSGTADQYSEVQQERFAEDAYRRTGYSRAWLNGQWGQTIGPCWRYAT
jgi:hypothetical protein